jgi:hypothetical protein
MDESIKCGPAGPRRTVSENGIMFQKTCTVRLPQTTCGLTAAIFIQWLRLTAAFPSISQELILKLIPSRKSSARWTMDVFHLSFLNLQCHLNHPAQPDLPFLCAERFRPVNIVRDRHNSQGLLASLSRIHIQPCGFHFNTQNTHAFP